MDERIPSLLLVFLVASLVIIGCGVPLLSHATQCIVTQFSGPTVITEESVQDVHGRPIPHVIGDPVDDPTPHLC